MSNFIKISSDKKQLTKLKKLQNRLPVILDETPENLHKPKTHANKWPPPFKHYSYYMTN